jgi:predicted negative regulator of RcsB-dependent stress response
MAKQKVQKGNNEMNDALSKSEAFFLKYKKAILGCLAAIIILVIGIVLFNNYKNSRNEEASTALAKCQELIMMGDFEKALKGDSLGSKGFIGIIDEYGSTKAGNLAKLYAALCCTELGKWQDAEKYMNEFEGQDDILITPAAMMAKGDIYANLKKPDEAIECFKKAAKMADDNSLNDINNTVAPLALKKAAIILISQKKESEALEIFQTLKKKYVMSPIQGEVDKYIEYLSK